ncbi:MAG: MFS transporter [Opitutales bacterium]|nr:MFS transporter [Opitutales bacterium]
MGVRFYAREGGPHWLRAFRHRNYRLFFLGQTIALNGNWMTMTAMGWLLFRLTEDPFLLGLMAFCLQAPAFLLASFGGLLVDRVSRRGVLLFAQGADALAVAVLAFLTFTNQAGVPHVLATCLFLGVIKALDMPARQTLVADIVDLREDLPNAIALNSSIFHGARMTGPLLAGALVIPLAGEGACFLLHSITLLGAMICVKRLRPKGRMAKTPGESLFGQLAEGFRYTFGFKPVRGLVLLTAAVAFFGMPYNTLLPVFARQVLGGDSGTFGLLVAACGGGAVAAAAWLAMRPSVLGMGRVIGWNTVFFGTGLLLFACTPFLGGALVFLFVTGFSSIAAIVAANTIVQTLVEDGLRGRVMSLLGMIFMGAMPLGSLLLGQGARLFGAPTAVAFAGLATTAAGVWFLFRLPALREEARPVYESRGLVRGKP